MWEPIVEFSRPIPVDDLEVEVTKGTVFSLAQDRPSLYREVLNYWDSAQVRMMQENAKTLVQALEERDESALRKMVSQIGSVGQKKRLSGATLEGKKLSLEISNTTYMDFIGTNERAIRDVNFRKRLMDAGLKDHSDPNAYFANALAACTAIYGINPDGSIYVPIALRSEKVMIYPNVHHVFGGLVDVDEKDRVSFGTSIIKELTEEVGLSPDQISRPYLMGIVRNAPSRHPEAILAVAISIGSEELVNSWKTRAHDKFEQKRISIHALDEIPGFLEKHGRDMVPSGCAALSYLSKSFLVL